MEKQIKSVVLSICKNVIFLVQQLFNFNANLSLISKNPWQHQTQPWYVGNHHQNTNHNDVKRHQCPGHTGDIGITDTTTHEQY